MLKPKMNLPNDVNNNPINRAMGTPVTTQPGLKLGSATEFVDLLDLTPLVGRLFHGLSIKNLAVSRLFIGMGGPFNTDVDIQVDPNKTVFYDNQSFGPFSEDHTKESFITHIRGQLDTATGTFATGDIVYAGQPADGQTIIVGSTIFEFSNDLSKAPGNDVIVTIGADEDASWTNMATAIVTAIQDVNVSIVVGTNTVTITSNYGGTFGNGFVVIDGASPTGAVFPAGNVLAGGIGGSEVIVHVW